MTLLCTREQLRQMELRMLQQAPSKIGLEDVAKTVSALTAAATSVGLLVKFRSRNGGDTLRLLNPVVTMELFQQINGCGEAGDWWATSLDYLRDPDMTLPEPEDAPCAIEIISLATAVADVGIIVKFVHDGGAQETLRLSPAAATELFLYIHKGAEGLSWMDEKGALLPCSDAERTH